VPSYVQGPLAVSDFLAVWQSVVDPAFAQGFVQAGEGRGLEAYTQAMAQLARASQAVDTTTQAMFILPWSGQSSAPASGPQQATVSLSFSRTKRLQEPLILGAGLIWCDEVEPEYAVGQGTTVNTGRRFALQQDLVFQPGQSGPLSETAVADRPGYGHNNPQPGSIKLIEQPGTQYANTGATLTATNPVLSPSAIQQVFLAAANIAEVFLPQHVGQYVSLGPSTTPAVFRIVGYVAPNGSNGGKVNLEQTLTFSGSTFAGTFAAGEVLTVSLSGSPVAYLTFRSSSPAPGSRIVVAATLRSAASYTLPVSVGYTIVGQSSGATMTIASVLGDPPASFSGPVSWTILDWVNDWGLSVTNAAQPSGGTSAMLDELGEERRIRRISGEADATYRQRVAVPADTVSPNAVKRMLNRTLTKGAGLSWCFREVGTSLLPGFFWDWDAYDYDAVGMPSGAQTGTFVDGERVVQRLASGQVAEGHALCAFPPPAQPFVPGAAGTTGLAGAPGLLVAVASINPQPGGAFVLGVPVVGLTSGATFTPAVLVANPGQNNGPVAPGPTAQRVLLDHERFRGYFQVGVQPSDAGEFGFFWGGAASGVGGGFDFWDCSPFDCFYDGWALAAANVYLNAYASVAGIAAAGVLVEVFPMLGPCV
jgi:hypothetical protein